MGGSKSAHSFKKEIMTYTFTVSQRAEKHIECAYLWYEEQKPELGIRFLEALELAFSSIKSNPLLYSFRKNNIRGCIIKRFPYTVLFHVKKNNIRVIAVFHFSRKPNT